MRSGSRNRATPPSPPPHDRFQPHVLLTSDRSPSLPPSQQEWRPPSFPSKLRKEVAALVILLCPDRRLRGQLPGGAVAAAIRPPPRACRCEHPGLAAAFGGCQRDGTGGGLAGAVPRPGTDGVGTALPCGSPALSRRCSNVSRAEVVSASPLLSCSLPVWLAHHNQWVIMPTTAHTRTGPFSASCTQRKGLDEACEWLNNGENNV